MTHLNMSKESSTKLRTRRRPVDFSACQKKEHWLLALHTETRPSWTDSSMHKPSEVVFVDAFIFADADASVKPWQHGGIISWMHI